MTIILHFIHHLRFSINCHISMPLYRYQCGTKKTDLFQGALSRPSVSVLHFYLSKSRGYCIPAISSCIMSQPEFLVIGDSNVKRFYTKIGLSHAKNITFAQARNLSELSTAISSINDGFKFIILAFLTNLVIEAGDSATNDIDRVSSIEELYNSVIPLIR